MRIAVVGLGYVGLVTAACAADWDNDVVGLEADARRASTLRSGLVPFHEPGLDDLVRAGIASRRLVISADSTSAISNADLVIIAVGTHDGNGGWQTKTLTDCLEQLVPHIAEDAALVIRSTVPLRLLPELPGIVREIRAASGRPPVPFLCNPEFTREGQAVEDFRHPDRVVFGVFDDPTGAGQALLHELYAPVDAPKLVLDATDAALSKLAANLFLATKISFANELASLCDAFGAEIEEVTKAISFDKRIGGGFLKAGVGFGGSCLPHQVTMTVREAADAGVETPLFEAVDHVNEHQRQAFVDRLASFVGPLKGRRIALLGLTFKPDTDDLRDAPSLDIARRLIDQGAEVVAYDPMGAARIRAAQLVDGLVVADDVHDALRGADAAGIVTEWPEFRNLDWTQVAAEMNGRAVVDGRNTLPAAQLREAGLAYAAFGRARQADPAAAPAATMVAPDEVELDAVPVGPGHLEPALRLRTVARRREADVVGDRVGAGNPA
ncbi:MAG TPA: UDP-glucose/GDP-mannose dehydrogenase family protein [Candidatus Limnocylindrales bacterium]|nr:UDP-glucose/GDP-mannose dehydrogenase family protein [Candidatus Limnocylindrales bacterium]